MKKIVQAIAHLTFKTKLIILASVIVTLVAIGYLIYTKEEPTYAVKFGKLYSVKGNKAKLIGDYSEKHEIVILENKEVLIKKINWGDKETVFIINGEEHRMGPNGTATAEGNLIILTDDSKKKKKVDEYGSRVH